MMRWTIESVEWSAGLTHWALPLFASAGRWYGMTPPRRGVQFHVALFCAHFTVQFVTARE